VGRVPPHRGAGMVGRPLPRQLWRKHGEGRGARISRTPKSSAPSRRWPKHVINMSSELIRLVRGAVKVRSGSQRAVETAGLFPLLIRSVAELFLRSLF